MNYHFGEIQTYLLIIKHIYKVNYDKSIQYLQTNDMNRYKKLTFDGVLQSPMEMNENDFIEK